MDELDFVFKFSICLAKSSSPFSLAFFARSETSILEFVLLFVFSKLSAILRRLDARDFIFFVESIKLFKPSLPLDSLDSNSFVPFSNSFAPDSNFLEPS